MPKKIKKLLITTLSVIAFVLISAIGIMGAATSAPESVGTEETEVPVNLYTLDSTLVKNSIPLKNSLQTLSVTNIPFEVLDFTNKKTDSIVNYEDYSFYATNDPTFINRPFSISYKWFGKAIKAEDGITTISDPKSRLAIAKLYKVTPGSKVSFLIAKEDIDNKGGDLASARILFAEYDASLKLLNDGAWVSAQDVVELSANTQYVSVIIRIRTEPAK
jgi:hypothetical protein